jgi:hypothetical protein
MTAGIAILLVSIANLITTLFALRLQSKLDKTETRLRQLERRVG